MTSKSPQKVVKMTRSNSKVPESRDTKVSARKFLAQFGKKKSSKTVASKISNKYAKISKFTKTSDTDKNSIKKPQDVKIEKKTKKSSEMTEEDSQPDVPAAAPKSAEKPTKKPVEMVEKRERSSRGAKTKAQMQISLSSNLKDYDVVGQDESPVNGYRRSSKKFCKKPDEPQMSSSPIKFKAGPKCSRKYPIKPGPRTKRGRNFSLEEFYLDQKSIDEEPPVHSYNKKLLKEKRPKEKLKAAVIVRDLKKARNPSVRAAYEVANDYHQCVGQFKPMKNHVTVTYQKPKIFETFQHKSNPNRVIYDRNKHLNTPKPISPIAMAKPLAPPPAPPPPAIDPNKPPPITNYMSVKIEVLMNCLEKMYHHHLPLNAFTSRFPNARAKAMLTLMLDGHRKECENCDKILCDENVGVFHAEEEQLKMDMSGFGASIPTAAPVVDLSQYPDSVAEMKKLLVEKDAKIKALEKRLEALNKEVKTDEVEKLDMVTMLDGVNEPTMDKYSGKFLKTAGYRLVDLRLLRMALEICQTCHHGKMTLAEMSPEVEGNQEDLVTRLAFICTVCGPKAIFPTSPFSKTYPSNYSLNKLLLPLLGPSAYFHLAQFLQHNPDQATEIQASSTFSNQKPQLLVSVDHAFFDFNRPFDPPLPEDPDANMVTNASATQFSTTQNSISDGDHLKLKNFKDLKGPSSINLPPLKPLEPAETEIVTMNHSSNGSSNGSTNKDKDGTVVTRKIKACPELPPGCRITIVAPGTKLVSKNVKYSTTQKTGLAVGCYKVKEPSKDVERILIIRDENNTSENPAVVKELDKSKSQVSSKSNPKNAKKMNGKKHGSSTESSQSEIELSSDEDDSDDPSWGRKRKKKNDARGKKKPRKKY